MVHFDSSGSDLGMFFKSQIRKSGAVWADGEEGRKRVNLLSTGIIGAERDGGQRMRH